MLEAYSRQAKSPNLSYRQALAKVCRNATDTLVVFKVQVQEWKNVLLRGNDKALYEKHFAAFERDEKLVQDDLRNTVDLMRQLGLDAKAAEGTIRKHAAVPVFSIVKPSRSSIGPIPTLAGKSTVPLWALIGLPPRALSESPK